MSLFQWEVTYVNHLLCGREWKVPNDWPKILPGIFGEVSRVTVGTIETAGTHLHYTLPDRMGRLHMEVNHGYGTTAEQDTELLVFKLTARGSFPQSPPDDSMMEMAFNTGRSAIVRAFYESTGPDAHRVWEIVQ